jgi:D-alanyl-D-alanine dipeptidase
VVVTTGGWEATTGTLRRFERGDGSWEPVGEPTPIVVGRSGLGWGTGLHEVPSDAPRKQEGDGRAPAGAFLLTGAFGYAQTGPEGLRYLHATPDLECVDDVGSAYYNRVIDRADEDVDWSSHEEMRRDDNLYRLGILVDHNNARVPGDGSCIFLHIWRGPDSTTAGCTAMPAVALEEMAAWARIEERPVLVQLPEDAYARLREPWALP